MSGGPGRLLPFELKSEVVKLWVPAREGGWRKGCPMFEGPDLTQEPDSLEKLKELRDGGKEWGREYGWARRVKRELD